MAGSSITIFTIEQLRCVERYLSYIDRVCLDYALWEECDSAYIYELRSSVGVYVSLPVVLRNKDTQVYNKIRERIGSDEIDGIVAHDIDEIAWCKHYFPGMNIVSDTHVYIHNEEALSFLTGSLDQDVHEVVLGYELTKAELFRLTSACKRESIKSCVIVYGRAPMMITAGCIKKTYNKCDKKRALSEGVYIKDRYNHSFPILSDCNICTNVVYNDRPISLINNIDMLNKLKPDEISIILTLESEQETEQIMRAFVLGDIEAIEYVKTMESTTGHLKRGV